MRCTCYVSEINQAIKYQASGLLTVDELDIRIKEIKLERKHEKDIANLQRRYNKQWQKLQEKHELELIELKRE